MDIETLKTIIYEYSELKGKVARVINIGDSTFVEIDGFYINESRDFDVYYRSSSRGYEYFEEEFFPVDLIYKSDDEIRDYFRERRIKEQEKVKLAEARKEKEEEERKRVEELKELERLKKKYERTDVT